MASHLKFKSYFLKTHHIHHCDLGSTYNVHTIKQPPFENSTVKQLFFSTILQNCSKQESSSHFLFFLSVSFFFFGTKVSRKKNR